MGWFDDEEDELFGAAPTTEASEDASVVRADPGALVDTWSSATAMVDGYVESAEQAADEASEAAGRVYDDAWSIEEQVERGYDVAGDSVVAVEEAAQPFVDLAHEKAAEFARNAQTQFEADPIGFMATAGGAPVIATDTDASDGTMSVHVTSVYGNMDADWQKGRGSEVHGQAGMDWGPAPLLKVDLSTNDQGEITKAAAIAKVTVPLEAADVKGEWGGNYEKTADGYKANYVQNGGLAIDGEEITIGLHGGVVDHGERGIEVKGGPQASFGVGGVPLTDGFDIVEGAVKGSTDFGYSNVDGQETYIASQTVGLEGKVFGQQVVGVSNTLDGKYSNGPQGEKFTVSDRATGVVGNQTIGQISVDDGARYDDGTDADGNPIDRLTYGGKASIAAPGGEVIATTSTSTTDDNVTGATTETEEAHLGPQQAPAPSSPTPTIEPIHVAGPPSAPANAAPVAPPTPDGRSAPDDRPSVSTNPDIETPTADVVELDEGLEELPPVDAAPVAADPGRLVVKDAIGLEPMPDLPAATTFEVEIVVQEPDVLTVDIQAADTLADAFSEPFAGIADEWEPAPEALMPEDPSFADDDGWAADEPIG